jgi:hypothetical protein
MWAHIQSPGVIHQGNPAVNGMRAAENYHCLRVLDLIEKEKQVDQEEGENQPEDTAAVA